MGVMWGLQGKNFQGASSQHQQEIILYNCRAPNNQYTYPNCPYPLAGYLYRKMSAGCFGIASGYMHGI